MNFPNKNNAETIHLSISDFLLDKDLIDRGFTIDQDDHETRLLFDGKRCATFRSHAVSRALVCMVARDLMTEFVRNGK